jgi:hypothetical protein
MPWRLASLPTCRRRSAHRDSPGRFIGMPLRRFPHARAMRLWIFIIRGVPLSLGRAGVPKRRECCAPLPLHGPGSLRWPARPLRVGGLARADLNPALPGRPWRRACRIRKNRRGGFGRGCVHARAGPVSCFSQCDTIDGLRAVCTGSMERGAGLGGSGSLRPRIMFRSFFAQGAGPESDAHGFRPGCYRWDSGWPGHVPSAVVHIAYRGNPAHLTNSTLRKIMSSCVQKPPEERNMPA